MKIKLISVLITFSIVALLITLSPAQAFLVNFSVSENLQMIGNPIHFLVQAEIPSNEIQTIDYFKLKFNGTDEFSCQFYPNGSIIEGCDSISISQLETAPYGYSYGYGYGYTNGRISFNITLHTEALKDGPYTATIQTVSNNQVISEVKSNFNLILVGVFLDSCSLRAQNGGIELDNKSYSSRNKMNLYFPINRDTNKGKGLLIAQDDRSRISYEFDINSAQLVGGDNIIFDASGLLSKGLKPKTHLDAVVVFNKKTNTVSLYSDSIQATNMSPNFIRGC